MIRRLNQKEHRHAKSIFRQCGLRGSCNDGDVFGAFIDDELVGCVGLTVVSERDAFVDGLAVLRDHRQQGLGSNLLERVSMQSRKIAVNHLWLACYDELITYYQRRKFQPVAFSDVKWRFPRITLPKNSGLMGRELT